MPNNFSADSLTLNNQSITTTGASLYVNGVSILTAISGANPSTSLLSVPVSIATFGGLDSLLGRPAGFLSIVVSGISYKTPFYN